MKLTNVGLAVVLKGIANSILAMAKPSLVEINKMLSEFGMELIIKPKFYIYRSFPCMNFTWYVSGSDIRPDGTGSGILEWCINEDDAYRILAEMNKFSHFTDLKVSNTEWDKIEANSYVGLTTVESVYDKCNLTYKQALDYIKADYNHVVQSLSDLTIYHRWLNNKVVAFDENGWTSPVNVEYLMKRDTKWAKVQTNNWKWTPLSNVNHG